VPGLRPSRLSVSFRVDRSALAVALSCVEGTGGASRDEEQVLDELVFKFGKALHEHNDDFWGRERRKRAQEVLDHLVYRGLAVVSAFRAQRRSGGCLVYLTELGRAELVQLRLESGS
jgi:hypothetical protein